MKSQMSNRFISRKKVPIIIGLIFMFIVICVVGYSIQNARKSNSATKVVMVDQPANDGHFQFTVTGFDCGKSEINQTGDPALFAVAQGQFCILGLKIKNISKVPANFYYGNQYIYSSNNTRYSSDGSSTFSANPSDSKCTLYPKIKPGMLLTCAVAFDIPKSVTITRAMLHESATSAGVRVNLH